MTNTERENSILNFAPLNNRHKGWTQNSKQVRWISSLSELVRANLLNGEHFPCPSSL
jgi:hypothetical protein